MRVFFCHFVICHLCDHKKKLTTLLLKGIQVNVNYGLVGHLFEWKYKQNTYLRCHEGVRLYDTLSYLVTQEAGKGLTGLVAERKGTGDFVFAWREVRKSKNQCRSIMYCANTHLIHFQPIFTDSLFHVILLIVYSHALTTWFNSHVALYLARKGKVTQGMQGVLGIFISNLTKEMN